MTQNRLIKIVIVLLFIINNMVVMGQSKEDKFRFASFETDQIDNKIVLNWTINEEETSNCFEVERSFDGKKFRTIMYVLGPDPSMQVQEKFEIRDKITTKNKAYYRLKHINKEGIITFSPIKSPAFNQ